MSRAKSKTEWIRVVMANVSDAEPRDHFHCWHCGERQGYELPMSIDEWVAMSRAFIKIHKRCASAPGDGT